MTVIDRPELATARPDPEPPAGRGLRARLAALWHRLGGRRGDAVVLLPLLLLGAVVQRVNLFGAPQRIDDEGTYVAQAWAVFHLGELTHYTYWYDHPPLGWLQIAGYAELTGAFDRLPNAVAAGREFMVVLALVSAALLWGLARRLRLPRWAAAVATGLFLFSPLAVQFHRTVYLDNVATPWLLGAFLLVLSPKRRLADFAFGAVCFAVAVLSKETSLLLFPVFAYLLWQRSRGGTRRYAVAVSATLFVLMGVFYVLFAVLKGELVPGQDRTSLLGGVLYQLSGREGSGSIFESGTLGNRTVSIWLALDTVLPALALLATPLALFARRLRPFAVGMLVLLAMLVRPGYLPVPFVIAMLPLGALLVAGVAASLWEQRPTRLLGRGVARVGGGLLVAAAVGVAGVAAPAWGGQLRGLLVAPLDRPMTDATAWIDANVPTGDRILTDDALWVDLVEQGRDRGDVVWFYKPDTDPDVPSGADGYQWVVSTDSVRSDPASFPTLRDALDRAVPVVAFGSGDQLVEVMRVQPAPVDEQVADDRRAAAASAGQQLVANPALTTSDVARDQLLSGDVDPRVLTLLATLSARHDLTLAELPQPAPEEAAGTPRRTVRITAVDGDPVGSGSSAATAVADLATSQNAPYRPRADLVGSGPDASLVLTFPLTR